MELLEIRERLRNASPKTRRQRRQEVKEEVQSRVEARQKRFKEAQAAKSEREFKVDLEFFKLAIEYFGSQASLCKATGYSKTTICMIYKGSRECSVELAMSIQQVTDGKILASDLRPDFTEKFQLSR